MFHITLTDDDGKEQTLEVDYAIIPGEPPAPDCPGCPDEIDGLTVTDEKGRNIVDDAWLQDHMDAIIDHCWQDATNAAEAAAIEAYEARQDDRRYWNG